MTPRFREDKTTQAACILLARSEGTMSYMKLIKLLYLADRACLIEWGRPISFDGYVSMDRGPVLSQTYDLITDGRVPGTDSYWHEFISEPSNYSVTVTRECSDSTLSEAEEGVLNQVFEEFGGMDRWQIVEWMHVNLNEWVDPEGSAIPIRYHDILVTGADKTPAEAAVIEEEIEALALADAIFG